MHSLTSRASCYFNIDKIKRQKKVIGAVGNAVLLDIYDFPTLMVVFQHIQHVLLGLLHFHVLFRALPMEVSWGVYFSKRTLRNL